MEKQIKLSIRLTAVKFSIMCVQRMPANVPFVGVAAAAAAAAIHTI